MISDPAIGANVGAVSIDAAVASYHRHLRPENRWPATIKPRTPGGTEAIGPQAGRPAHAGRRMQSIGTAYLP
jgi:hypothetical protein